MSRTPCQVPTCGRLTDGTVCRGCARQLEQTLAETPWLVDELETATTRQTRYGNRYGSRTIGKTRPLPVDLRASRALDAYRAELVAAVRLLDPGGKTWPKDDPQAMARWLLLRVDAVRFALFGPDIVDRVKRRFAFASDAVDRPPDRLYAGPCFPYELCGADLYAEVGAVQVKCPKCGNLFPFAERREYLLSEAEDTLADATTIARAASWLGAEPLTAARVRQWASRKRLTARAIDRCSTHIADVKPPPCRACQPRYRVGDAIDLLAADTRRKDAR